MQRSVLSPASLAGASRAMFPMCQIHCPGWTAVGRSRLLACAATVLAATLALSPVSSAQVPAAQPPAPAKVVPSKACIAAGRKLTREQQALDDARADLARYTNARATCNTKTACARADSTIAGINKRIPRYEARLRSFHARQAEACAIH
jgi:hypothetical protein